VKGQAQKEGHVAECGGTVEGGLLASRAKASLLSHLVTNAQRGRYSRSCFLQLTNL
jgi:hypothetical protein